jgi:EAL domain-containing protein (putative c-di-GMP-specific phosphodiesterase class I)
VANEDPSRQLYLESLISNLTGWDNPRQRLAQAFSRDEFILYHQGIWPVAAEDSARTFVEVLVRHQDEERNLTPPGEFLPIIEYVGMLPDLDRWVVRRVLEWYKAEAHGRSLRFSLNADALTLSDPDLPEYVADHLSRNELAGDIMCFEIPEIELLARADAIRPVLKALQQLGCRIAIGSVGRQSVSFKAIQSVAADYVKIDGALIRELSRDKVAHGKVNAINRVCQSAGIETVAEFVEDAETLDKLKAIGVNYAQGYGLSPPAPLSDLAG